MRPAPRRPGNSSTWSVMRAPAESTSQTTGSSWRSACSVTRTIFSTVRAPHEPAFTVGSLAMTHTGRPSMRPMPVTTPSAGQVTGRCHRVGEQRVLDERAVVEQQREAVAHEQLVLRGELVAARVEVAGECPLGCLLQLLVVLAHALSDGEDGDVVVDRRRREVASGFDQRLAQHVRDRRPGRDAGSPAMRSSPNMCSPSRASARPSV